MRIPDSLLQYNYSKNFSRTRGTLTDLQLKLATLSEINKPSDDPLGNSRVMRMQSRLNDIEAYQANINYASGAVDNTISTLNKMNDEMVSLQSKFTELNSGITSDNLEPFAEAVNSTLELLVDLSNTDFNGTYLFGGTDGATKPIEYDKENKIVKTGTDSLAGDKKIKISSTITQKFNISGKDLFQSVLGISGNLDLNAANGDSVTENSTVYNSEGKEFELATELTKTNAHTYQLTYTLRDDAGSDVLTKTVDDLVFDEESNELQSIDGNKLTDLHIVDESNKIDFVLDLGSIRETNDTADLNNKLNRKADIFNTLITIRDNLKNDKKPTEEQLEVVSNFKEHIVNMMSYAGGISNKLTSAESILSNQSIELQSLISDEKDINIGRTSIDLMSAQYSLEVSYKISSMLLPKSILDYL